MSMAEDFEALDEIKKEKRRKIEPKRYAYAKKMLKNYRFDADNQHIKIRLTEGTITFWVYTGWYQGQKPLGHIKGRGIKNLIRELEYICEK